MPPVTLGIVVSVIASAAMAQGSAALFSDHIIHLAAKIAYDAKSDPKRVAETQKACSATLQQVQASPSNIHSNLDYCAAFDMAVAAIAAHYRGLNADATVRLNNHRISADMSALKVPLAEIPMLTKQISQKIGAELQKRDSIATARPELT